MEKSYKGGRKGISNYIGKFARAATLAVAGIGGLNSLESKVNGETIVSSDFFVTDDSKAQQLAILYNQVVQTNKSDEFYGTLKWENNTNVATGNRVWVLDGNKKPCGIFDVASPGFYGSASVYADDTSTPEDDGASVGDNMSVLVEKISTNEMYNARFENTVNYVGDEVSHSYNIFVNPSPIPLPSTLALLGSGAFSGAVGFGIHSALKKRK